MKIIVRLLACGVRRRFTGILLILLSGYFFAPKLVAQMSEAEKKRLFLQAREDIRPVTKPSPSPTPRPRPKPVSTPKATPVPVKPKPTPVATPTPRPESTPATEPVIEKPSPTTGTEDSDDFVLIPGDDGFKGRQAPVATAEEKETPSNAKPTVQIPKGKTPEGRRLEAPILIEKSGLQEDAGYEPPSKPIFGGFMKRWRYLTPAVRKAIDNAKVQRGRWKYIIVHNSGTRQGNARIFENYHRRVRKMQNGLAYHFVIGNGNSSGNGQIEIGNRWTRQINGGHVASNYLNDISIGICLVGDLNRDLPTKAQMEALDELCTYLRGRVGRIKGKQAIVKGHKEINPKPTDCPGDRFPLSFLRKRFGS
ncbi:MAG: peptidoglycan recognition family protein [Verrucomicrobiota bacterium]